MWWKKKSALLSFFLIVLTIWTRRPGGKKNEELSVSGDSHESENQFLNPVIMKSGMTTDDKVAFDVLLQWLQTDDMVAFDVLIQWLQTDDKVAFNALIQRLPSTWLIELTSCCSAVHCTETSGGSKSDPFDWKEFWSSEKNNHNYENYMYGPT